MNLFDMNENTRQLPLASRMRPEKLDEIVGQLHIIGKDKLLYRAIKADRLGSIILYGPPGVGKTTIARVIANTTKSYFCKLNATNAGIKDLEKIIEEAKFYLLMKFIALIKHNKIIFFLLLKMELLY